MRLSILILLLAFAAVASAQGIPSFARLPIKDSADVSAVIDHAMGLKDAQRDSALYYMHLAYKASARLGYVRGQAKAAQLLGTNETRKGKFARAMGYYKESIGLFAGINDQYGLGKTYMMAGVNEGIQNKSAEALAWFLKSMKIFRELGDEKEMAELYYKIGLVYGQVHDFDKAIAYQNKSLEHAVLQGDKRMQMGLQTNIGLLYARKKDYQAAIPALHHALRLGVEQQHQSTIANVYLDLGNVYRDLKRFDSSAYYLSRAHTIYTQVDYPVGMAGANTAVASLKADIGQFDSALVYLENGMNLARKVNNDEFLLQNFLTLQAVHRGKGQYGEAAALLDTILKLTEIVGNAERTATVERVKMEDETEEKETTIRMLEQENKLKTLQRNVLLLMAIAGICLTLLIIYFLVQHGRKNRMLNEQKKELEELNMVKDKLFSVISHDLRGPFTRIIGVLDLINTDGLTKEEQSDIISQLHLSTAATLSTLDNLLMWGSSQIRQEQPKPEPVKIRRTAESAIELYHHMAAHKSIRLLNRIDEHCSALFNRNQFEFIIRNLIANAIKFSYEGQEVTLDCRTDKDRVILQVTDQGMGMSQEVIKTLFNPREKKISRGTAGESGVGLGLTLIMEFLDKNNGQLSIASEEGKGSVFTVSLPAGTKAVPGKRWTFVIE